RRIRERKRGEHGAGHCNLYGGGGPGDRVLGGNHRAAVGQGVDQAFGTDSGIRIGHAGVRGAELEHRSDVELRVVAESPVRDELQILSCREGRGVWRQRDGLERAPLASDSKKSGSGQKAEPEGEVATHERNLPNKMMNQTPEEQGRCRADYLKSLGN